MARTFTLVQLRTRALQLADRENDNALNTSEANDAINAGIAFVWNELTRLAPEQHSSDQTITTSSGTMAYALPATFRSSLFLYSQEFSDGSRRPIDIITTWDRANFKAPTATYTLIHEYVPSPTLLSSDSDTFDGVCGFEDIVAAHAARRFLQKEEGDISVVQGIINEWLAQMQRTYQRQRGPRWLNDVDARDARLFPTTVGIRGYRIRGDNIEVYENVLPLMVPS